MVKKSTQKRGTRPKRGGRQGGIVNKLATALSRVRVAAPIGAARVGTAALPASYATHVKSWYQTRNVGKNKLRVLGCDLVYRIPDSLATNSSEAFVCIPCNPAYWMGTRVASIASTYSNYRPLRMQFHYVPQVAVTNPGTTVMGTLWNQGAQVGSLQQTLLTSNGGQMCQCYIPADTTVDLRNRTLPQDNFYMAGSFNRNTNPFVFMAVVQGSTNVPGYFFVSYAFDFWNPVGESFVYITDGPISLANASTYPNATAVLISADDKSGYGPGTTMVNNGTSWTVNERVITPGNPKCYVYYSQQSSVWQPNPAAGPAEAETVNISSGLEVAPVVTRTPDSVLTTNEGNWWTRIKSTAGNFIRRVAVPAGKSMLVSLMNPENRKMAQIAFNPTNSTTAQSGSSAFGWNKLNFGSLGTKAISALTSALGRDPRTFTDMLVSTKAIAGATATMPSSALRTSVDLIVDNDEFNGYTQDTTVGSENVISTSVNTYATDATTQDPAFYYDADGNRITITSDLRAYRLRGGNYQDESDIGDVVQASFVQGYQYTGEMPPETQTIDRDSYEAAVDALAKTGVSSIDGVTVAAGGIIGDLSRSTDLSTGDLARTNNYAANQMEFHVGLLDILPSLTSEVDAQGVTILQANAREGMTVEDARNILRSLKYSPSARNVVTYE